MLGISLRTSSLALGLLAAMQAAPPPKAPPSRSPLEITLERKTANGKVEPMASDHVFATGDVIRFRVTSGFDGYLYVMDQGSSGQFRTVFPSTDAGSDNRLHQGQGFLLPATDDGWFEVSGPTGFDVLYFLLSPEPIAQPAPASFVAPGPISSLKPRCNDAIFKARGECTDITAGPTALPRSAPLPAPLAPLAGSASRDITVLKKKDAVTVEAGVNKTGPILYTFRLAHR